MELFFFVQQEDGSFKLFSEHLSQPRHTSCQKDYTLQHTANRTTSQFTNDNAFLPPPLPRISSVIFPQCAVIMTSSFRKLLPRIRLMRFGLLPGSVLSRSKVLWEKSEEERQGTSSGATFVLNRRFETSSRQRRTL